MEGSRGLVLLSVCLAALHLSEGNSYQHLSDRKINQVGKKFTIIGGDPTTIEKHPYEVSVITDSYFVAGVILNKNWVLTSAATLSGSNLQVRVGSNSTASGGTLYSIKKTIINPDFNSDTWAYDLALHKLCKPIALGKTAKIVQLATKLLKKGQKAVVSGWGNATINGNSFKEIELSGVTLKDCAKSYSPYGYTLDKSMTCAMPDVYTNGPFYDFGAPLVIKNKVYGLYSNRVIASGVPPIFSSIVGTRAWITKTIKT